MQKPAKIGQELTLVSYFIAEKIQEGGLKMADVDLPKGPIYRYYVHPQDRLTNNVLSQDFEEAGNITCSDGKTRFMFSTRDHLLIAYIQRSRASLNLKFRVFIQEGQGKVDPWPFDAAKKRRPKK